MLSNYLSAKKNTGIGLSKYKLTSSSTINTSQGLYDLAIKSGLQKRADKVLSQKGEETKKIFSGGFISDIFDGLNALQFGIVGMLKGKSFAEGVNTRQSWSDKDALGEFGIPGMIGGIALDIACDPLTYIAPWTIAKKVPGLTKGAKAIKTAFKATRTGKFLGRHLVWRFGQDPVYKLFDERRIKNIATGQKNIQKLIEPIIKLPKAAKLLTRTKTGSFIRTPLSTLKKTLTKDEFWDVTKAYSILDDMGGEAVKLGLLSKGKWEANLGEYIKNAYTKFELPQIEKRGVFGFMKKGTKGIKKRKALTLAKRAELGEIKNPAYLMAKSIMDLSVDIENTKLFNMVAKKLSSNVATEGFIKLPITKRLFTTATGEKISMFSDIKNLNQKLKPAFSALKKTFKADKQILSEIHSVEKAIIKFGAMRSDEFAKFFQAGQKITKVIPKWRRLGTLPDELVSVGQRVKKFKNFDDLMKSDVGLALEKLDISGQLERLGFGSTDEFFKHIKNPFKSVSEMTKETLINKKAVQLKNILTSLEGQKDTAKLRNLLAGYATEYKSGLTKSLGKLLDITGMGKNKALDLQKIGIKTLDDLLDINKTGGFDGDVFDSLEKIRKLFGKNSSNVVDMAQDIVAKNDAIKEIFPLLSKFKSKEELIKQLSKKISGVEKMIGIVDTKNLSKLVKLQKGIENLSTKATKLKGIDKRSIDDAYRFLEDTISKITREKEGIFEAISKTKLGELSGKFVPQPIFDSIQEITRSATAWEQATGKIVAGFKFGKVIMNPATHGRNVISNTVLNWWKLGLGPWRIDRYAEAVKEIATEGKWYQKAVAEGMDEATYAFQELNSLLLGKDALSVFGKAVKPWKKIVKKLGDIYQGEEKVAKLAAFIHKSKAGLNAADAWKAAESATFNYGQITPFIRKVRTSLFGFPFITFTYKATPLAIETALKHPGRISALGKIKQGIESQSDIKITDRERASEPAWVRDGFYIKLPIKDKDGRSAYFDLTYIIPFGDMISGDFFDRMVSRETGIKEGTAVGLIRKSPFFNFVKEISGNQDFYGNKIWKDGDNSTQQLGDLFRHLTKTYSPPLIADQIPGGYITQGKYAGQRRPTTLARTKMAGEGNQYRNLMQEMLRNVGLKVQPINVDIQENYMEQEKKKALETILGEAGVTREFTKTYVPK